MLFGKCSQLEAQEKETMEDDQSKWRCCHNQYCPRIWYYTVVVMNWIRICTSLVYSSPELCRCRAQNNNLCHHRGNISMKRPQIILQKEQDGEHVSTSRVYPRQPHLTGSRQQWVHDQRSFQSPSSVFLVCTGSPNKLDNIT